MKYNFHQNVVIKDHVPKAGVVCSNPQRVERIVKFLDSPYLHTDSWGIKIYCGGYNNAHLFIASVPMGSAGAGFAALELYAAGAEYIIRYGTNDRQVTEENLEDVIIVDEADNLIGLMKDSGFPYLTWNEPIRASTKIINSLEQQAIELKLKTTKMICHNIDDYHAFNYPESFDTSYNIKASIRKLELTNCEKSHCWDMESSALFFRARQFKKHGATVLQSIIKHNLNKNPYDSELGIRSIHLEIIFCKLTFSSLSELSKI